MASIQSTNFWKHLNIVTTKRSKALKKYSAGKDFAALRKMGVLQQDIDDVYKRSAKFNDALFFNKLSRFFRKDVNTVVLWAKKKNATEAFVALYNKIHSKGLKKAEPELSELDLIFKFYEKGVRRIYSGIYSKSRPISKFNATDVVRRLNRFDDAKYVFFKTAKLGNAIIIGIKKISGDRVTYKFIKIEVQGGAITVSLSMDSNREYNFAKIALEKSLNTVLDTPQSTRSLVALQSFLKTGESSKFILCGATYFDNEFKLAIGPAFAKITNVAGSTALQTKLDSTTKKEEVIIQLKLYYKDKRLIRPLAFSFLTHKSAGIMGAIMINPNDRKLSTKQRADLYADFLLDFHLPLNEFVDYPDLSEKDIYQYFLETAPNKDKQLEVRSSTAIKIYKQLLTDKLVDEVEITKDQVRFCVNQDCTNKFRTVWNEHTCRKCGDILIAGKKLVTKKINEERIANYLKNKFTGAVLTKLSNQLLSRKLCVAKITYNNKTAEIIPITAALSEHQIEVLKFRYPHAILITSRDDVKEWEDRGCTAIRLFDLIYSFKANNGDVLKQAIDAINVQYLASARSLCATSIVRITNIEFYKAKNKVVKNFGAELFEADASVIMDYVFGNCIWLGAKYRGKKVPDGLTAFPILSTNNGCFIWDGKFSEGKRPVMGNYAKNKTYIEAGKMNPTLKANGGLLGFVFISNRAFPVSIEKKYSKLPGKRQLKVSFLTAEQLQTIGSHFREHEKLISNNAQAKQKFIDSMVTLFFSISNGKKVNVITSSKIDTLLAANETFYTGLSGGKPLAA